jgi:hypothetical protein
MTPQFLPQRVAGGAVCEWNMVVRNIVEEVNLILLEHQARSNRVDRGIAPAFVEESAIVVEGVEEV